MGGLFYAFLLSLVIGTVLTPVLMYGARRWGLLDHPGTRKVHKEPIARVGGIAFAVGALLASGYWAPHTHFTLGILVAALIIVGMGSLDDCVDLRVSYKFGGQFLAAGVVLMVSSVTWQPFGAMFDLELSPWLALPLTMVLLVAMTNAMNLSDGLDGLAAGLAFLSFGLVAFLAYQLQHLLVLGLALPVMGGLLGFLRFNTFPARVFMGDGGSQFLGFLLGVIGLMLTQQQASPLSPLLVLWFMGVPLVDLAAVTTQRVLTGGKPFQADQEHLHHKLLKLGFSHHQVVLVIYALQIGLIGVAYVYRWSSDAVLLGLYLLVLAGMGVFYYGVYSGRLSTGQFQSLSQGALYWRTWIHARPWLAQAALVGLSVGMMGFFLLGLVVPSPLPDENAYFVLGAGGVVVGGGLMGSVKTSLLLTRMGLYLASTVVLYGVESVLAGYSLGPHILFQGIFGLLVIGLLLAIHLDKEKRFTPNPMDYLLLFLALLMPVLLDIQMGPVDVGEMLAKLIVLFFACEVLLQAFSTKVRQLGYGSGGLLCSLATQALW